MAKGAKRDAVETKLAADITEHTDGIEATNAEYSKQHSRVPLGDRKHITTFMEQELAKVSQHVDAAAGQLDLAFVVDATGSMGDMLKVVKDTIDNIIVGVCTHVMNLELRLAFVAYRDVHDGPDGRTQILPFQKIVAPTLISASKGWDKRAMRASLAPFVSFVTGLTATGGRDYPEDIASGLEAASALDWQSAGRLVILSGDAPCHGTRFHSRFSSCDPPLFHDEFPNERGMPNIIECLKILQTKDVLIHFLRLTKYTDQMLEEFNKVLQPPTFTKICHTDCGVKDAASKPSQTARRMMRTLKEKLPNIVVSTITDTVSVTSSRLHEMLLPTAKDYDDLAIPPGGGSAGASAPPVPHAAGGKEVLGDELNLEGTAYD